MEGSMDSRLGGRRAELQRMRHATEDDLMAQQQAFLAQPQQPSAKVVRATRSATPATNSAAQPVPSAFKREQMARQAATTSNAPQPATARSTPTVLRASAMSSFEDDDEQEDDDGDDDEAAGYTAPRMVAPAVLSEIVERDVSSHTTLAPSAQHIPLGSVHKGFPSTFRITTSSTPTTQSNQPVKKSLFAQQRDQERLRQQQGQQPQQQQQTQASQFAQRQPDVRDDTAPLQRVQRVEQEQQEQDVRHEPEWRQKAKSTATTDDQQRISAENEQKIAEMSIDDIEQAQRELHTSLPPALIARLMQGRTSRPTTSATPAPSPPVDRQFGQRPQAAADSSSLPPAMTGHPTALASHLDTTDSAPPSSSSDVSARSIPVNPSPIPYPKSAKTEWMSPVPSPTAPPQWQQLAWHTGLTSTTSSSSSSNAASAPPTPSDVGTAWQYWRLDFTARWIDERSEHADTNAEEDRYDGLYHHGQHAERAGYSLDEIIYLCHSQLPAQRQLMIELLTRILQRIHTAAYTIPLPVSEPRLLAVDFNALIMERLMVLGVVTVLRVAIDDPAVGIVAAGIRGIEALLFRRHEQQRLRQRRLAYHGQRLLPAELSQQALDAWDKPFQPAAVEHVMAAEAQAEVEVGDGRAVADEDVRENSADETVCRRDVVIGLIRMQLLPRLRFLLEVHSTSTDNSSTSAATVATESRTFPPLVHSIIHILLLVAQHSASATEAVTTTPHLLPLLASLTLSSPHSTCPIRSATDDRVVEKRRMQRRRHW